MRGDGSIAIPGRPDLVDVRAPLARVAQGLEPGDTAIVGATVFDAVTQTFVPDRAVWIKDGRIARVASAAEPVEAAQVIDAAGMTLVPGLIDGHSHLVRWFVPEFVGALLPTGCTSVVIESMEYGVTEGFRGIRPFVESLRGQPLRLYYTAPALCGLTEEEEVAPLASAELAELLADPLCVGLGESYWSNALLPGIQGVRVRGLIAQTLAAGKPAEGHTAGARGARLDAYVALGISSCHEPISVDEALEVYRRGLFLMLREGGIRQDLANLRPLFDLPLDFSRLGLVTDGVDPVRLASWGYLDQVVREALALGIPPHVVYRMASTNTAEHFGLARELGYLLPGRYADLVAIPAPGDFSPVFVMVGGRLVHDHGETLAAPRPVTVAPEHQQGLRLDADRVMALAGPPPSPPAGGGLRVIEYVTGLVTQETILAAADLAAGELVPVLALERTRGEQAWWGFLKGLGLQEGAYATTLSWDSPDLLVVGRDEVSVRTALAHLIAVGGGSVFTRGAVVVAASPAPIAGVASAAPAEQVRAELVALEGALRAAGVFWPNPILAVETLTTPAIPHLRMSHRGYVRVKDREVLPAVL